MICWPGPGVRSAPSGTRPWPTCGARRWTCPLAAASKLVEKRLDSDTDRKLVVDFLASLDDKK